MRGVLRRRPRSPAYDAFLRCAAHVDLAQRAMIRCVPSSARSAALPLPVGAQTLRVALADAAAELAAWRVPDVAGATDELEVALTPVQDLLDPLHAFVDAERALSRLR
jgi:hypothetical protein